jgi:hypothetical protein
MILVFFFFVFGGGRGALLRCRFVIINFFGVDGF